jgi:8-oxo-dGTP diphosphatase
VSAVAVAVGAVARRDGDLLLVRRGHGPASGRWSLPGGRVEFGEDLREAVVREVAEETGLEVVVERFAGWAERIRADGDEPYHFVILDFLVAVLDPTAEPVAASDAADARWVPIGELESMALTDGLVDFLAEVGVLPETAA